ncbi:MAG: hypothetical protein O9327_10650 [Polaromonas sp.]|nr:hypothetical protein [Polaromonas sp.]
MRKVLALSLDDTVPSEAEFLNYLDGVPKARRQEWGRLLLRAGFTFYKDNLGKPGFEGFHEPKDNGPKESSAKGSPNLSTKPVQIQAEAPAPEPMKASVSTDVPAPAMGADVLRGMFKVSSGATANAVGQESHQ